jgi:asparagine synthase (glutamine-hydrolysing)
LVSAQGYAEDGPHGQKTRTVAPLLSQPLIEDCLSIPSWHWFAKGCNRAAARQAFARELPPRVIWRHGKGAPDSFVVRLFEANRRELRDHLCDGVLARSGMLDVPMIKAALDDPSPQRGTSYGRLLKLADTESWARGIMAI